MSDSRICHEISTSPACTLMCSTRSSVCAGFHRSRQTDLLSFFCLVFSLGYAVWFIWPDDRRSNGQLRRCIPRGRWQHGDVGQGKPKSTGEWSACRNEKKVPVEWQARQVTQAILVSSSKQNAKKQYIVQKQEETRLISQSLPSLQKRKRSNLRNLHISQSMCFVT